MRGECYIDGRDIFTDYGVSVAQGQFKDLLKVPALKDPVKNEWFEYDGVEVDLEATQLQNKQVSIMFQSSEKNLINDFIAMLTDPGYRKFYFPLLDRSWDLRISAESNIEMWPRGGQKHTMMFYDDVPRRNIYKTEPAGSGLGIPRSDYAINDHWLSDYGLLVESARSEVFNMPTIRQNLEREISVIDGKIVSTLSANMKTKNVTLDLCFSCKDLATFWTNYAAFFYMLTSPGEHIFYIAEAEEDIPCYYDSTSNFQFFKSGENVLCKFKLTLVFITFRIRETDYLLAAEDYTLIVLEDGETFIDMEVYN